MIKPDRIARLCVTLQGITPVIWRRVEVPQTATLKALHDVIQGAFGWEDRHLHVFEVGEARFGVPNPEWDSLRPIRSEKAVKLAALIERGVTQFTYIYDFGDNWHHRIEVETVQAADSVVEYPRFVAGERRAPPEDVGGEPGYEEFVRAMTRQRHPEHAAMVRWYGGPYDPDDLGEAEIVIGLAKLARRRALGRAAYLKRVGRPS